MMATHEVTEIASGVFYTRIERCSVAVIPHVLSPDPSYVWIVDHGPDHRYAWRDLSVPLTLKTPCEVLRVRLVQYDLQMSSEHFVDSILPRLDRRAGMILLQLERPVNDSLLYRPAVQTTS